MTTFDICERERERERESAHVNKMKTVSQAPKPVTVIVDAELMTTNDELGANVEMVTTPSVEVGHVNQEPDQDTIIAALGPDPLEPPASSSNPSTSNNFYAVSEATILLLS